VVAPLIDPADQGPSNRFMPPSRGEGMTGSLTACPHTGTPVPEDDNAAPQHTLGAAD